MSVRLHPHARQRLVERGASEAEVFAAVEAGEQFAAKFGRTGFRRNFAFGQVWKGREYATKQVETYAVKEDEAWLVITVVVRFFGGAGMKLTYDPRYNIAYLRLHEKTSQVETFHLSDELNVDIAPDGTVYGIELLNANQQVRSEDHGNLIIVNEALGNSREISLE